MEKSSHTIRLSVTIRVPRAFSIRVASSLIRCFSVRAAPVTPPLRSLIALTSLDSAIAGSLLDVDHASRRSCPVRPFPPSECSNRRRRPVPRAFLAAVPYVVLYADLSVFYDRAAGRFARPFMNTIVTKIPRSLRRPCGPVLCTVSILSQSDRPSLNSF